MTAEDGCDCYVLSPWAWCRACGGEDSDIPLIRCQTCGLVKCSINCGFVMRNTPETPTDGWWEQIINECHACPIPEGAWKEYPTPQGSACTKRMVGSKDTYYEAETLDTVSSAEKCLEVFVHNSHAVIL